MRKHTIWKRGRDEDDDAAEGWKETLRDQIVMLHEAAEGMGVGGGERDGHPGRATQILSWLYRQDVLLADNPTALKLTYTESLVASMAALIKANIPSAGAAALTPAKALRTFIETRSASKEAPNPSVLNDMKDRIRTLERINTERNMHVEQTVRQMQHLEDVREGLAEEVESLSLALAEETQKVQRMTALGLATPAGPADMQYSTRPATSQPAQPAPLPDANTASGLHRLFTSRRPQKHTPLESEPSPPIGNTEDAELNVDEVLGYLEESHPGLAECDKQTVARRVVGEVGAALTALHSCEEGAVLGVERGVSRLRGVIQGGVALAGETQRRTGQMLERCRTLEHDVKEKTARICVLETYLDNVEGGRKATKDSVDRLQTMLDAADARNDSADSFIGEELKSLRDAFSIKLSLANDEVDLMQKRHLRQLEELQEEKSSLKQTIHSLQGRLHCSL